VGPHDAGARSMPADEFYALLIRAIKLRAGVGKTSYGSSPMFG